MYALSKGVSESEFFEKVALQIQCDGKGVYSLIVELLDISNQLFHDLKLHLQADERSYNLIAVEKIYSKKN